MKIKNILNTFIIAVLSCGAALGMERIPAKPKSDKNIVTPFVPAAASFALARYAPEYVECFLPQDSLAHEIVPPLIKYGGYGMSGYLANKALKNTIQVSAGDLVNPEQQKKLATLGLTLAPAALCHPGLATAATRCCTALASNYASDANLEAINRWMPSALMLGGGLGTVYLVNRNLCNGKMLTMENLEKLKKIAKDSRKLSPLVPLCVAYNAESVKNMLMVCVPDTVGNTLKSDMASVVKYGICYGGIGLAAYLFATDTLGLATKNYVQEKVRKLVQLVQQVRSRVTVSTQNVENATQDLKALHANANKQTKELHDFKDKAADQCDRIEAVMVDLAKTNGKSQEAVDRLKHLARDLNTQAINVERVATDVKANLAVLKKEHELKLAKLAADLKEDNKELLAQITTMDQNVSQRIKVIESLCTSGNHNLGSLKSRLDELILLLSGQEQSYNFNQQMITSIDAQLRYCQDILVHLNIGLNQVQIALENHE